MKLTLTIITLLLIALSGCVTVYDQTNVYVNDVEIELEIEK